MFSQLTGVWREHSVHHKLCQSIQSTLTHLTNQIWSRAKTFNHAFLQMIASASSRKLAGTFCWQWIAQEFLSIMQSAIGILSGRRLRKSKFICRQVEIPLSHEQSESICSMSLEKHCKLPKIKTWIWWSTKLSVIMEWCNPCKEIEMHCSRQYAWWGPWTLCFIQQPTYYPIHRQHIQIGIDFDNKSYLPKSFSLIFKMRASAGAWHIPAVCFDLLRFL